MLPSAIAAIVLLGIGLVVAGYLPGVRPAESQLEVAITTATPTATAVPETPTPAPTETPTPVATGTAFPPPPARTGAIPTNTYGISHISAPRLNLDSYIEIVHIVNGEMQAPVDGDYSVGYYPEYARPGDSGNMVFAAHETWNHMQGPFYSLHFAEPGDDIYVQMADGTQYHYQVMTFNRYDINTIPMSEVLNPTDRPFGGQWLTLITCGGTIVYDGTGYGEYLQRDVVVAKRVA